MNTIDEISIRGGDYFIDKGYLCGEAVLLAVTEYYNIQSDFIPKLATGFCGGMSRACGTCGAISGGILAINIILGRSNPEESYQDCFKYVQKLFDSFQEEYGSINCFDYIICDLVSNDGRERFKKMGIKSTQCRHYVEFTTKKVLTMLENKKI